MDCECSNHPDWSWCSCEMDQQNNICDDSSEWHLFCFHISISYIMMPFGLKNTSTIYQRAMQRCMHDQLGGNVEAYVDDVVIKSRVKENLISNLSETFVNLRHFRWKLNPDKCVFGVPSGKLLSFIVSYLGIKANPEKLKHIFKMNSLTALKDVQKLTGCMAALSRFVSWLGERVIPSTNS